MHIYDFQIEQLDYDEWENMLKIVGIRVTYHYIWSVLIPVTTSVIAFLIKTLVRMDEQEAGYAAADVAAVGVWFVQLKFNY